MYQEMSLLHNYLGGPFGIIRDIYVSKARYCDDPGAKIAGKCGILMYFWGLGFYLSSPLSMENISKYGFVWVWVCGNLSMETGASSPYFHMAMDRASQPPSAFGPAPPNVAAPGP